MARAVSQFVALVLTLLGVGTLFQPTREPGERDLVSVYWTWETLEPDTVASAWLLQRFAEPGCSIEFVQRGQTLDRGTPFDMPLVDLTRNRTQSTARRILERWSLADTRLDMIVDWIDETEIGGWDEEPSPPAAELERRLRQVIARESDVARKLRAGYEILDELYQQKRVSQ